MGNISAHQVIVYHDETKDAQGRNFKGHVLLFVPVNLSVTNITPLFGKTVENYSPQRMLFTKLIECRQEFACYGKLHFSELSGQTWKKYDFAYRNTIEIMVDALRHKSPSLFPFPLKCKIAAIFYEKGADWKIYGGDTRKEQILRHDETLLRILLKGAAHYLYDDENTIEVTGLITDGNPAHRQFNEDRVLWRLTHDDQFGRKPLRDYVNFSPSLYINHLPSNHNEYEYDSEEYLNANFLQIADLLLGSIIRAGYKGITPRKLLPKIGEQCVKKDIIAQPIKEMLDKKSRGSGFLHSSHYKAFTISKVDFTKGGVNFTELNSIQIQDQESLQMPLDFHEEMT